MDEAEPETAGQSRSGCNVQENEAEHECKGFSKAPDDKLGDLEHPELKDCRHRYL